MALLVSEDRDFVSFIKLTKGSVLAANLELDSAAGADKQLWQMFEIEIGSGERRLHFSSDNGIKKVTDSAQFMERVSAEQLQDAVENQTKIANAFMFCRKPSDEIKQLTDMVAELIAGKRSKILFEPAEPGFELSITNIAGGMRVDFFVDAGNVETGIYRWDALGVRFFTDLGALDSFASQLKAEFGC